MRLGFVGTGKITSSVVTGICRSKINFTKILLSPRNRNVAKKLKEKFKKISIAKKIQLQEFKTSWLFFAIDTFLNFFLSFLEVFLFLGDKSIFLKDTLDLHIPVTTDEVILPVPIKPNFIIQ